MALATVTSPPPEDRAAKRGRLLAAVADAADTLAAAAAGEEEAGRLSDASVDALYGAGVLAMKAPACLGGGEADPVTQFEVLEAVSAVNASAGWCSMVGATSLGMPGAFLPDEGVANMFGGSRLPRGAIVIMPAGVATRVDGGYRVSGRWSFASGIHHAEWITATARIVGEDGSVEIVMLVFPAIEATLHDNWQVAGLKGTGSCDFTVEDLFVPAEMSWTVADTPPRRGGPLYTLGIPAFVANEHAAFALGVARAALDTLVETAAAKSRGYGAAASKLARRATVQRAIGHAEMALGAARAHALALNEEAWACACAGEDVPGRLSAALRASATYCTEVATEVVTTAFRYTGAGAVYAQHRLQRCLRDVNVAAQHLLVSDRSYENLGQFALGLEDADPMG